MADPNTTRAETVMGILTLFLVMNKSLKNILYRLTTPAQNPQIFETTSSSTQEWNGLRLVCRLMATYFQL